MVVGDSVRSHVSSLHAASCCGYFYVKFKVSSTVLLEFSDHRSYAHDWDVAVWHSGDGNGQGS